jgi:hypothetical protein
MRIVLIPAAAWLVGLVIFLLGIDAGRFASMIAMGSLLFAGAVSAALYFPILFAIRSRTDRHYWQRYAGAGALIALVPAMLAAAMVDAVVGVDGGGDPAAVAVAVLANIAAGTVFGAGFFVLFVRQ